MPALESISIKGFKSIREVEVKLRDINVLIGANGSGKSNFLGAFSLLHAIRTGNLQRYIASAGGADKILHFGSRVTEKIRMHICFQEQLNEYEIALAVGDADTLFVDEESAYFAGDKYQFPIQESFWSHSSEATISDRNSSGIERNVRRHLGGWWVYHFEDTSRTSPLRQTAQLNDNRHFHFNGSNLAAYLYLLREKHEDSYRFLRNTVRLVAPFFDDFVLEPLALNEDTIRLEWKHVGSDAYFNVSSLSDGTLRFIALAALLQQPKELRPSVILLDEPELGLHPYAITMLASMVKSASVDTQVILATQSPILLDYFEPEDVLVADRVDGATEFRRLSSDNLAIWLKDYSIGELWEKNYLEGNPMPERRMPSQ